MALGGMLLGGVTGGVVGGAIVRLMLDDKQFKAGLAQSQGQLNATAGSAKATGASIMRGLALPMAAAAGLSIKAAIDFESAFAGVRKTVDATEAQFAVLERGIRDMALEVPSAATEIAGVAEAAGQLGIATDDILGFTRVMIDLGVATDITARDAAVQLARMANIMQTPTAEFENMGSTIVHLGNNLAATESEIVKFATRIAGAGQVAGLAEADVLSLAGALTDVGVPAERGGTAVQKMLLAMNDAVATGNENLAKFAETAGMTADEFASAWRDDAAMAVITFVEGLGRAGDDATTVLRELGLGNERTIASFLSLAGAGDKAREALELGRTGWQENIALSVEAAERYKTMASQITILMNRLKEVGISLGQALMPLVQALVTIAGPLADVVGLVTDLNTKVPILAVAFATLINPILGVVVALHQLVTLFGLLEPGINVNAEKLAEMEKNAGLAAGTLAFLGKEAGVTGNIAKDTEAAVGALENSLDGAGGAAGEATGPMGEFAEETENAHANARELYNALLGLAGGFLGLAGASFSLTDAQVGLREAQAKVNELVSKGEKGTKEYRDAMRGVERAELAVIESKLGLTSSVQEFVMEQREAEVSTKDIISQIKEQGKAAGLTTGQVQGLVGMVKDLIAEEKKVPPTVRQRWESNVNQELADVRGLVSVLNGLDGRLIRYTVVGSTGGHGQRIHSGGLIMHDGGPVRMHSGGLRSDERTAILQTGEFVMSRAATARIGAGNLAAMNSGDVGRSSVYIDLRGSLISSDSARRALVKDITKGIRENQSRSTAPLTGMPV